MLKNQSTSENLTNSRSLRLDLNRMRYPAPKYLSNLTNLIKVQSVAPKPLVIFRNYGEKSSTCKEQKLLKFPALKLEETIPKFLKTVEPLVNEAEYKEAEKATQAFAENEGKELQALLEAAAATEENWLAPRWLRHAYLQYRDPVTVYTSPGMTFPLTEFASDEDWCGYTANVVNCLAQFKIMVDQCKMPVVKMGKLELDNSQFGKVFGTNRMPAVKEDIMEYNPNSKHVVVIYKGHFFKMPIFTENGQPIHPKILKAALLAILKNKKEPDVGYGILTTDNRDNWAEAYCILRNKPGNEGVLKEIQSALFTVSLDDHVEFAKDKAWNVQAAQLIHGGGPNQNSKNRWMDKTIQLVVNRNGMSGFTYEHSPAEGQPIAVMMDYCVQQLKDPSKLEGCEDKDLCVEYLRFADADPCIEQWLAVAERNVGKLAAGLQLNIMHFKVYGKDCIKVHKMSPDSFIQIALQYAFYKMYGQPAAQYESAHLRIYYGGRTETIRSCSVEAVCFAKAMLDKSASLKDKVELLKAAVNGHRAYTSMALQGKGVDRHLLGLKLMAIENKLPIPKFFCTPGVLKSAHFRVSTSQVATPNPSFMAYGPSTADGYGCCYNPRDCDIIFAISNWFSNETNCDKFGEILNSCLVEMRSILDESAEQPKSKL